MSEDWDTSPYTLEEAFLWISASIYSLTHEEQQIDFINSSLHINRRAAVV
jgi:hypothetical protein